MQKARDKDCQRSAGVASWEGLRTGRYRDMVVYALGLGLTLLLAWIRDPYALF